MEAINVYLKGLKNKKSNNQETLELLKLARSGDDKAKETLVENYLLLVFKIAKSYINKGVDIADLVSEGNVGLLKAVEKYDMESNSIFSSYAKIWIKQSIIRNCFHDNRVVKLPENVSELIRTDRWEGPSYSQISIDLPNEEGDSLSECISDNDSDNFSYFQDEESMLMKNKVERILSFLQSRDAEIVKACYGIGMENPMDVEDVAELYGMTTTRVKQILKDSLKKIRIAHDELPESNTKQVEILSAVYGDGDDIVTVTDKVIELYTKKDIIKVSNKLGGDPCPGVKKSLTVYYDYEGQFLKKSFTEGSVVKF